MGARTTNSQVNLGGIGSRVCGSEPEVNGVEPSVIRESSKIVD